MTQSEVAKLVAVLMASFPHAKTSAATSGAYERMLADLDYESADAAVSALIATSRYMPTIAEIRDATITVHVGRPRAGMEAWGDVRAAVGRYGRDRMPQFDDPITAAAVERIGWREFCLSDVSETPSWRARFVELYERLAAEDRRDAVTRGLPAVAKMRTIRETTEQKPLAELLKLVASGAEVE